MFALSAVLICRRSCCCAARAVDDVAEDVDPQEAARQQGRDARKPRYVWSNPIAWREAKTKASAARASIMRYGFMAPGLSAALVLVSVLAAAGRRQVHHAAATTRRQDADDHRGRQGRTYQRQPRDARHATTARTRDARPR
jgi:hypothetical protein